MDKKEIQEYITSAIKKSLAEIEVSSKLTELESVKKERDALLTKLSEAQEVSIPTEKVEEITEVVEKAIGDKVDSLIGEKLADIVERVDDIENSMTNKERVKKALSNKKSPFKAMSRPAKAFTQGADVDVEKELNTIIEKLKSAKDKKALEEVTSLLNAFVTSAKKMKLSADEEVMEELEAYRELGSIDEIEAAIEVLEVYAEEAGTLPELETVEDEEVTEDEEVIEEEPADINIFSSKKSSALSARKRKQALSARRKALQNARKAKLSAKAQKVRQLKQKSVKLSSLQTQVKKNMELSSKEAPGALATELFKRK